MNPRVIIDYKLKTLEVVKREIIPVRIKFSQNAFFGPEDQWILVAASQKQKDSFVEYSMQRLMGWTPK